MQISLSEVNCLSTISYVIHLDFPLVFALFDELSWGDGEITGSSEVRYSFLKKVHIHISPPLRPIIITPSSKNPIFNSPTFANKTSLHLERLKQRTKSRPLYTTFLRNLN